MSDDRSARLLAKRAQIDAQLKVIKLRQNIQERKNDTRRKVIAGALALEHAELNEGFRHELFRLLHRYVKRTQDRALFGLEEVGDGSKENTVQEHGTASNDSRNPEQEELSAGKLSGQFG